MKIIEKLTQRLDHMVPDRTMLKLNDKKVEAFMKALEQEEKRIAQKLQR